MVRNLNASSIVQDLKNRVEYLAGKVKVDEYVTHTRKFEEIQGGFHDMHVSTYMPAFPFCF